MNTVSAKLFTFEGSQLTYQIFGTGSVSLLAFHGFGQTSQVFSSLTNCLGNRFTVFAIDLFFHGNSRYVGNGLLTKAVWSRLIAAFLDKQKIHRFSLMGFSLGGRFALATLESFPDRVDQFFLLAPDGITRNLWYQLATSSTAGRGLFLYFLNHLSLLNSLGHGLTGLGLLNRTVMRFAELSLGTTEQRALIYQSWTQFRSIQPDLTRLSQLLNEHAVQVHFFVGAFDRIVPGSYILPLTKRLNRYRLTILPTGHNHLIERTAHELADDFSFQRFLNNVPKTSNGNDNQTDNNDLRP